MNGVITDDDIFSKIGAIMTRQEQNRRLQELANQSGLDVKNTFQFTEESTKNIASSIVALMLAKRAQDPAYEHLCRVGLSHRSSKVDLINKYKDQANQMIERYKLEHSGRI